MKNLFVCHTQANLILASGLALGRFKDDENLLILFVDFGLKEELKERLDKTFTRTLYLQSIYPAEFNTYFAKLKWYPEDWRQIKAFMAQPYSNVFVVCDTILLEQKIMQRAYRMSQNTVFSAIEDGIISYYKNANLQGGFDTNIFTRFIRRIIVKDFCGIGRFYDRDYPDFSGTHAISQLYSLYPEAVREPFKSGKIIVKIEDNEYLVGLKALYPQRVLPISPGDILLLMDKLDTYSYPEKVKEVVSNYIKDELSKGKRIFCKFHPRETDKWDIFNGCEILDKSIGAESMFLSLANQAEEITVVGIKSAGIMSAKKLGFKTVSLFSSCGEENLELVKFFSLIGIEMK